MFTKLQKQKKGFTIFFAVLVASLALAIGVAIYDLTVRELSLSGTTTQSQTAIDDADSGVECALYWDSKDSGSANGSSSAFPTSTNSIPTAPGSLINCSGQDISQTWVQQGCTTTSCTTAFFLFFTHPRCTAVTIYKYVVSGIPHTAIFSYGFNNCASNVNQLERTLQVTY